MALKQVGALPYRVDPDTGRVEVLLVTSRRSGRWIIPKGNIDAGREARTMAVTEAFEEAGVEGALLDRSIGDYDYEKVHPDGTVEDSVVEVFALGVTEIHDDWPEREQRQRRWADPYSASEMVEEAGLASLILVFATLVPRP